MADSPSSANPSFSEILVACGRRRFAQQVAVNTLAYLMSAQFYATQGGVGLEIAQGSRIGCQYPQHQGRGQVTQGLFGF